VEGSRTNYNRFGRADTLTYLPAWARSTAAGEHAVLPHFRSRSGR
jgi:hypothetical protein